MKKLHLLLLVTTLLTVSCGKPAKDKSDPVVQSPVNPIHNIFVTTNPRLTNLDLRNVELGVEFPASDILEFECTSATLRGNPARTTVSDFNVLIQGDSKSGTIQFGRLPSSSPNNNADPCLVVSTEKYSYVLDGSSMVLCNLNYLNLDGSPKYCDTFTALQ